MYRAIHLTAALLAVCASALLWSPQAQAHARLVTADPRPEAAVPAPKSIQLHFSTELAKKFSSFKLTDTDGNPIALKPIDSADPEVLEALPSTPLGPGLYTVSWTAVSTDDGHKTSGQFSFTVQ